MRVCQITTVHPRYEKRILYKQCFSLKEKYCVYLIVADGLGDENNNGVKIIDIGERKKSILNRVIFDSLKAYKKALAFNCDVYHFHDPELIFMGYLLKLKGKKVIYDVHEDLPRQILTKPYGSRFIKKVVGNLFERIEHVLSKRFDYIVTVTNHIGIRFKKSNSNTIIVKNYPNIDKTSIQNNWKEKKDIICYIGSISEVRGIKEIIKALEELDAKLYLGGLFNSEKLEGEVRRMKAWSKVKEFGYVNEKQASEIYRESKIGLVLLHPTINYLDALPTKLFEYMLAGLPVVVTNIPLWAGIVNDHQCGLIVDPFNNKDVVDKITYLLDNDSIAETMGKNGQSAVKSMFNWSVEEKKLLEMYKHLEHE